MYLNFIAYSFFSFSVKLLVDSEVQVQSQLSL